MTEDEARQVVDKMRRLGPRGRGRTNGGDPKGRVVRVCVVIGPALDGSPLELGALVEEDGGVAIVHAMTARTVWRGRSTVPLPLPESLDPTNVEEVADWFESDAAPLYFLGRAT